MINMTDSFVFFLTLIVCVIGDYYVYKRINVILHQRWKEHQNFDMSQFTILDEWVLDFQQTWPLISNTTIHKLLKPALNPLLLLTFSITNIYSIF